MNNRELYQKSFSRLHASGDLDMEGIKMREKTGIRCRRRILVVAAVLTVLTAMTAMAYAVTGGQVIRDIKVFIGGRETDSVVVQSEDGRSYRINVKENEDGSVSAEIRDGEKNSAETQAPAVIDIEEQN